MEGMKLTQLFVVFLFLGPVVAALGKLKSLPKCAGKNALLRNYEKTFKIKSSTSSAGKRELSWPISCLHVAIVKDENNNPYFSLDIHGCCNKCQFPWFTFCMWTGNPDWLCASEAYGCIFQCRQATPALASGIAAANTSGGSGGKKKPMMSAAEKSKKLKRREKKCFRKKCKNKKQCCWRYRCLPLAQLLPKAKKV